MSDLDCKAEDIKRAIPVGSIDFVARYLDTVHGITTMSPIEVPRELRNERFLKRDYKIVGYNEIPRTGCYFIKDASKLKQFTFLGETSVLWNDNGKDIVKDHLFVVSEIVDILAEYRVFVSGDNIMGIQFYDGNSLIMPSQSEIHKLQEAVLRYSTNPARPRSYALDIAIIRTDTKEGRDLVVIECCPFTSLGTYGFAGAFLPYMYRDGVEWYIKHNTPMQKYETSKS